MTVDCGKYIHETYEETCVVDFVHQLNDSDLEDRDGASLFKDHCKPSSISRHHLSTSTTVY